MCEHLATLTCRVKEAGIKPLTSWLLDSLFYLLSHSWLILFILISLKKHYAGCLILSVMLRLCLSFKHSHKRLRKSSCVILMFAEVTLIVQPHNLKEITAASILTRAHQTCSASLYCTLSVLSAGGFLFYSSQNAVDVQLQAHLPRCQGR